MFTSEVSDALGGCTLARFRSLANFNKIGTNRYHRQEDCAVLL